MNKVKKLTAEVLPHFQARKLLQRLGCRQVVVPEVRTKGKTGNMVQGRCHDNVAELVARYGGKHLTGFSITKRKSHQTSMVLHSIWENPEGNFIEVTKRQDGIFRGQKYFAILFANSQGEPAKFPHFLYDISIDGSTFCCQKIGEKYAFKQTQNGIPWKQLKNMLKNSAPVVADYSIQDDDFYEFQKELRKCGW